MPTFVHLRRFATTIACATAFGLSIAAAQAPVPRPLPDALLSIDQNRATVVDRIVADWSEAFAKSNAGIDASQLRTLLQGMRADYLLAASLAGSLDGLRQVIERSIADHEASSEKRSVASKSLGDGTDDLVYTPVTPCRIVDTRLGAGGVMLAATQRDWLAFRPSGFASQGGSATDCAIATRPAAVMINVTLANTVGGPEFFTVWPFNQARPTASTLNWFGPGQQPANAVAVPLCSGGGCTADFSAFASGQTQAVIDVIGYFAPPVATAVQCASIASSGTTIAVSSDTTVTFPSCAAGFTRTSGTCSGPSGIPSAYLVETKDTGCVFRNLSAAATYSATATSVCCRIPGR